MLLQQSEQNLSPHNTPSDRKEGGCEQLFDASTTGQAVVDIGSYRLTRVNLTFCEITGYAEAELLNMPYHHLIHPADWDANRADFARALGETGPKYVSNIRFLRKDGGICWVHLNTAIKRDETANSPGFISVTVDQMQNQLPQPELSPGQQFQIAILDSLQQHIVVLDNAGNVVAVNAAWERFAKQNGISDSHQVGVGSNYLDALRRAAKDNVEDAQTALDGIQSVLAGTCNHFEMEYDCSSSTQERWFLETVVSLAQPKGGLIITQTDISGRQKAETQLLLSYKEISRLNKELQKRLEFEQLVSELSGRFVNIAADRVDAEITVTMRQILNFFAVDSCCLIRMNPVQGTAILSHAAYGASVRSIPEQADMRELFLRTFDQLMNKRQPITVTAPGQLPVESTDLETYRSWEMQSAVFVPVLVAGCTINYTIAVSRLHQTIDVHDEFLMRLRVLGAIFTDALVRKASTQALLRSEQQLAEAQRIALLGSWDWDLNSGQFVGSDGLYRLLGYSPMVALQKFAHEPGYGALLSAVHPKSRKRVARELDQARHEDKPLDIEFVIVRTDGSERDVHMLSEGIRDEHGGTLLRITGTLQDVTASRATEHDLHELRAQLWHAERAGRIGTMNASLAHELNQPLAAILSNAQAGLRFMESDKPDLVEIREILGDIVQDDKRAGAIIKGLRNMLGKQQSDRKPVDLVEAIDDVTRLLHSEIVKQEIYLLWKANGTQTVIADRTQIQQVVMNLIMNAIDAMADLSGRERRIEIWLTDSKGGKVSVAVRDFGTGIPEDLSKIFEPFWSTKAQGLGIGLAVCRSIIAAHGGRLWAERNKDRGCTFFFELPGCDS